MVKGGHYLTSRKIVSYSQDLHYIRYEYLTIYSRNGKSAIFDHFRLFFLPSGQFLQFFQSGSKS